MSENDLRFDSCHRWLPPINDTTSQALSEVEEGAGNVRREGAAAAQPQRRRTPPPPRPPPPKWEQFHRRRASHHAIFPPSSATPHSILTPGGQYPNSSPVPPFEASRQRSYSLPPERREAPAACPHCCCQTQTQGHAYPHASSNQKPPQLQAPAFSHASSNQSQAKFQEASFSVAPPSPMFSRRAFRPVAPPHSAPRDREAMRVRQQEREASPPLPPPPPPAPPTESRGSR